MFERYTERARRAIYFARWWTLQRGGNAIETYDLILGVSHEPVGDDDPLAWINGHYPKFVAFFAIGKSWVKEPELRDVPLSQSSKIALAYAAEEAGIDKRYSIEAHHLFRGILRTKDVTAKRLEEAGYSLSFARDASARASGSIPDGRGTLQQFFRWRVWTFMQVSRARIWQSQRVWIVPVALLVFVVILIYLHSQN